MKIQVGSGVDYKPKYIHLKKPSPKKGTRMSITTGTGWAYVKRLLIAANSILSPSYNTYQYFCKAHSRYDLNPARVPIFAVVCIC